MPFAPSERLRKLPPYLFAEIDRKKRELLASGRDVVDLGVGDPDLPTPSFIVEALAQAARDPRNHRYALDAGMPAFREAIARYCQARFGVSLDPANEILPLIGSKEGIAHLPLAVVNPGDTVLVPDPCYPPYRSGAWFAGAEVVSLPLLEKNGFFPDFHALSSKHLKRAKLLFLNYPNNPTGACATSRQLEEAVRLAQKHGFVVAQDAAYVEVCFDGYRAPSLLAVPGAREVGIEFHSLSKTFNMTGWRVGFAAGNRDLIAHLAKVKANIDSGIFQAIQVAAIAALEHGAGALAETLGVYAKRRDLAAAALAQAGYHLTKPKASLYLWVQVPHGLKSAAFCEQALTRSHVVVTPGNGFGPSGEGYFRISLTVPTDRLKEGVERLAKLSGG